jgi:uncharacterized membrane protein
MKKMFVILITGLMTAQAALAGNNVVISTDILQRKVAEIAHSNASAEFKTAQIQKLQEYLEGLPAAEKIEIIDNLMKQIKSEDGSPVLGTVTGAVISALVLALVFTGDHTSAREVLGTAVFGGVIGGMMTFSYATDANRKLSISTTEILESLLKLRNSFAMQAAVEALN